MAHVVTLRSLKQNCSLSVSVYIKRGPFGVKWPGKTNQNQRRFLAPATSDVWCRTQTTYKERSLISTINHTGRNVLVRESFTTSGSTAIDSTKNFETYQE